MSMKFQLLMKFKMLKNKDITSFLTFRCCIYHANKWHFNILRILPYMGMTVELSMKKFYYFGGSAQRSYWDQSRPVISCGLSMVNNLLYMTTRIP